MRLNWTALLLGLGLYVSAAAAADTHKIDVSHSTLGFKVRHLMTKATGKFKTYSGDFDFDAAKVKDAKFNVEIETASIFTDNDDRDKHLRSEDFFDAAKFPKITFKSTKVDSTGKESFNIHGDLTMRGVTKPVVIAAKYFGETVDPWGNTKAGFEGTLTIKRKDFGINWNKALDKGGVVLGEDVDIDLNIETENVSKKKSKT